MRKLLVLLMFAGAGFAASYLLFEVATASAAQPRSAVRISNGHKPPVVLTGGGASKAAVTTTTGAIVVPASSPSAAMVGAPQVSYTTAIEYLPHGRTPQELPPGVLASSNQIQRMSDRRFRFSFFNNSVIPNTATIRPVSVTP